MNLAGLDLPSRSVALGFSSSAEYVRFCYEHPEISKAPLSPGAIARTRRHDDAGCPAPDFMRLMYMGDDTVRAILVDTLGKLPRAFAWHCVEFVGWLETGRSSAGWMVRAPSLRTPSGDAAHLILLDGGALDEQLAHTIAHEASHAWHALVFADSGAPQQEMSEREWLARRLLVSRMDGPDAAGALARALYFDEKLADETASAFGFPPTARSSGVERLRGFQAAIAAASPLADEIERDLEANNFGADKTDRCAATPTGETR